MAVIVKKVPTPPPTPPQTITIEGLSMEGASVLKQVLGYLNGELDATEIWPLYTALGQEVATYIPNYRVSLENGKLTAKKIR